MPAIVPFFKFVGTISLGLLTGVSYTLSTQSLPSLLTLPSAKPAAHTLSQTTKLSNLHIWTLSALSTTSLALAYILSPSGAKHPYLLWTALVAGSSGALGFALEKQSKPATAQQQQKGKRSSAAEEEDWEQLGESASHGHGTEMNGEQVEKRARDQQFVEFVRTGVSLSGFAMGVIGVWGDKA